MARIACGTASKGGYLEISSVFCLRVVEKRITSMAVAKVYLVERFGVLATQSPKPQCVDSWVDGQTVWTLGFSDPQGQLLCESSAPYLKYSH